MDTGRRVFPDVFIDSIRLIALIRHME